MIRLAWALLLLLLLAGCAFDVTSEETTAPLDEEGEKPLDVTPAAPVAPQPSAVRPALPVATERKVEPRNPTPDPWAGMSPNKPTPDPWSPEGVDDEECDE